MSTPIPVQSSQQSPTPQQTGPATSMRRARQNQLSTTSLYWGIPANHEATLHAQVAQGDDSWQYRLLKWLHGSTVQVFLASLLLLDVLILFCELALLTMYPSCHMVERDAISCCPIADEHMRWLAETGHDEDHSYCAPGLQAMKEYEAGCDKHKWSRVHNAETGLLCLTLTILGIFFIELTLTMIALKPSVFFRQVFYALDYFIVAISLALEISFLQVGDDILASLGGLVILGRVWRFVRIGHGILELAEDIAHERQERLLVYAEELEDLLNQNGIPLPVGDIRPPAHSGASDLLERLEKRHRDEERATYRNKVSGDAA